MSQTLYLPAVLRPLASGRATLEVRSQTVGGVFDELRQSLPQLERKVRDEQGEVRRHIRIYLGDTDIQDLQGQATPLPDGASVHVIPAISGGVSEIPLPAGPAGPGALTRPSLFEFAGGEPAFQALAAAHHRRCLADPELEHPFSHGVHPEHAQRLGWYWAEVFGGPERFSQECGGEAAMLGQHAGYGIPDEMGARFLGCFLAAADEVGLPADPHFRRALRSYMEWAVAEVLRYSPEGTQVEPGLSVPHWGWEGLVPEETRSA
ncbi:MAG: MoaD/ThiS family protein [Candidatus Dormibacteria bacterium]